MRGASPFPPVSDGSPGTTVDLPQSQPPTDSDFPSRPRAFSGSPPSGRPDNHPVARGADASTGSALRASVCSAPDTAGNPLPSRTTLRLAPTGRNEGPLGRGVVFPVNNNWDFPGCDR